MYTHVERQAHRQTDTHHVELPVPAEEDGGGEGGEDAASHGKVGVDDGPGLGVAGGQGSIEARPKQPEEEGS